MVEDKPYTITRITHRFQQKPLPCEAQYRDEKNMVFCFKSGYICIYGGCEHVCCDFRKREEPKGVEEKVK